MHPDALAASSSRFQTFKFQLKVWNAIVAKVISWQDRRFGSWVKCNAGTLSTFNFITLCLFFFLPCREFYDIRLKMYTYIQFHKGFSNQMVVIFAYQLTRITKWLFFFKWESLQNTKWLLGFQCRYILLPTSWSSFGLVFHQLVCSTLTLTMISFFFQSKNLILKTKLQLCWIYSCATTI